MKRRLPPLSALRAFEAVARHLSFTKAADELSVTPTAIGHQIRTLEEYFGYTLVNRTTRTVSLTTEADNVLPLLTQGFDCLREASTQLRLAGGKPRLNLSVEINFASKWLVDRLDRFYQLHPNWEVYLDAKQSLSNMAREEVDICIRFGPGDYVGLQSEKLFDEEVFPVCAPGLLERGHSLKKPEDLRFQTLLHEDWVVDGEDTWPRWDTWLEQYCPADTEPTGNLHFSDSNLTIQAAVNGKGVALTGNVLVADDLSAGRLVRPFGSKFTTAVEWSYYLVYQKKFVNDPKIIEFRNWIFSEIQ